MIGVQRKPAPAVVEPHPARIGISRACRSFFCRATPPSSSSAISRPWSSRTPGRPLAPSRREEARRAGLAGSVWAFQDHRVPHAVEESLCAPRPAPRVWSKSEKLQWGPAGTSENGRGAKSAYKADVGQNRLTMLQGSRGLPVYPWGDSGFPGLCLCCPDGPNSIITPASDEAQMGTNVSTNEVISLCAPSISTWTRGTNKHKPMYLRQFAGHKRAQAHVSDWVSHMATGHKRAQTPVCKGSRSATIMYSYFKYAVNWAYASSMVLHLQCIGRIVTVTCTPSRGGRLSPPSI